MSTLTDLASVRQFMQKVSGDTSQDADIEVLIVQASEAIPRFCNREFVPTEATTRSFEYRPSGNLTDVLDLVPYEVRSISKIVLDPEEKGGTELTTQQHRPWSYPARDGTFFGVRLNILAGVPGIVPPFSTRRVDITGNWGMEAVPEAIKRYANVTVESWLHLRRDAGVPGSEAELEGEQPTRPDDLPPGVRWGLKQSWMRPDLPA